MKPGKVLFLVVGVIIIVLVFAIYVSYMAKSVPTTSTIITTSLVTTQRPGAVSVLFTATCTKCIQGASIPVSVISLDGVPLTNQTVWLVPGSVHVISALPSYTGVYVGEPNEGKQFTLLFESWTDGGAISHTITVTGTSEYRASYSG